MRSSYSPNFVNQESTIVKKSHILLASLIAALNVLYFDNYTISLLIVVLELCILMFYFFKNNITKFLGNYLIFLCLSFEFNALIGMVDFYGFKNFRIMGINLGILSLLPLLILVYFKKISLQKIKTEFPKFFNFVVILFILNVTGFIIGLLQILVNDNNILGLGNVFIILIEQSYSMIALPFLMIIALGYIITWEQNRLPLLKSYLISILIGLVVSMIVSIFTGRYGWYGGVETLLISSIVLYSPFMFLFPFYKNYKSKLLMLIFALSGTILSLIYNATGKLILITMILPIAILMILIGKKRVAPLILTLVSLPILLILAIQLMDILFESKLFEIKFIQAISMFKFWDPNWIYNMPLSPQTRIIEFISIAKEYGQKPWYLIFGKGFTGTFTDHTGFLSSTYVEGAFSEAEWANGTFYGVHETINVLFLNHGLVGLFFYMYMFKFTLKNTLKSPWILIGGFWFLVIYGFSITMSAFGICALLIGLLDVDKVQYGKVNKID